MTKTVYKTVCGHHPQRAGLKALFENLKKKPKRTRKANNKEKQKFKTARFGKFTVW